MLCAETLPTTSCFLSPLQAEESTLQGPGTVLGSGRAAPSSECLMPLWSPLLVTAGAVWMRGLEHSSPSTALINRELGCSWNFFSWSSEGWKSQVKVLKSPWVSKPPGFLCVFSFGVCLYRAAFPAPVCFWVFAWSAPVALFGPYVYQSYQIEGPPCSTNNLMLRHSIHWVFPSHWKAHRIKQVLFNCKHVL